MAGSLGIYATEYILQEQPQTVLKREEFRCDTSGDAIVPLYLQQRNMKHPISSHFVYKDFRKSNNFVTLSADEFMKTSNDLMKLSTRLEYF